MTDVTTKTRGVPAESLLAGDRLYRVGALAAVLGVVMLLLRHTTPHMHPMGQPGNAPENSAATFAEYAAHEYWVAAHLLEPLGFAFVFGALVAVSWRLRAGRGRGWALLGALGAGVSLSLAAAVRAVDGIALKVGMPLLFSWFLLVALFLFRSSRRRSAYHRAAETHDTERKRTRPEEDHVSI